MHDGITFEQYGKPGLVLCTHPFDPTSRMIAKTLGMPDFRYALVDHPIGSAGKEAYRRELSRHTTKAEPSSSVHDPVIGGVG